MRVGTSSRRRSESTRPPRRAWLVCHSRRGPTTSRRKKSSGSGASVPRRSQIGYQSLDDDVLTLNQRGHDVAASRHATKLLRQAGFKIQAHWMANLYGSIPAKDVADFERLFSDPDFRPDELKLYPCSLIESAELMVHYEAGRFRPYGEDELLEILVACMTMTPSYCRLTRVIRDIPGGDILAGSRVTNFRTVAEEEIKERGLFVRDIRAREIRGQTVSPEALRLDTIRYETSVGDEAFLQFVSEDDRIAGFLRLCLLRAPFVRFRVGFERYRARTPRLRHGREYWRARRSGGHSTSA